MCVFTVLFTAFAAYQMEDKVERKGGNNLVFLVVCFKLQYIIHAVMLNKAECRSGRDSASFKLML